MAWAAAAAGPVLILLYLLRLRRRPVRVSTVRHWPQAAKDVQVNVPLRMLRPSWLLLLHLLIVGLAVCAVGRPAVRDVGGGGGRVVLLIDTSASMSALTARSGVTRLDDALARARELVRADRASPPSQFAVVVFAAEPHLVCGFGASHRAALDALSGVSGTDQPGDLRAAIELAASLLEAGDEETPRGTIAVLSDEAPPTEGGPAAVRVERLAFQGETTPPNLGIVAFAARRSESSTSMVDCLVELMCSGPDPAATMVEVTVDNEVVSRVPIIAAGNGAKTAASFQIASSGGGVLRAALPGADALAADDSAALVLAPAREPRVLVVSPESGRSPAPLGSALLREVLSELRTSGVEVVSEQEWQSRGSPTPPPPSVIVFDRVSPRATPDCPTLTFGADAPGRPGLLGSGEGGPPGAVFWDRRHSTLRHVSLDGLSLEATPIVTLIEGWRPIARCSASPIILSNAASRWPRLLVTFDLTRSNWPVQPGFPVFVASAVDFLISREVLSRGEGFTTGEAIEMPATPGTSVSIEGPQAATARAGPGAVVAVIPPLARAGLYSAGGRPLAVNLLNASESSLRGPGRVARATGGDAAPANPEERREVWHWFAAGTLALLCFEWLVYARAVRV